MPDDPLDDYLATLSAATRPGTPELDRGDLIGCDRRGDQRYAVARTSAPRLTLRPWGASLGGTRLHGFIQSLERPQHIRDPDQIERPSNSASLGTTSSSVSPSRERLTMAATTVEPMNDV